ncbi:MAG: TetR family transcriptional regulator [Betaproteobacteria bacterium HGW-Betaproteobacteria-11]|nr:MAG: TetR family transcriptional regulator [Betaproteobacteria bacterium HGW-Betaproteobacteria-11]
MNSPRPYYQDTRQHILANGQSIILGKGFAAVGLSEILAAAEVPKGSFYHYFESKEAFGAELIHDYFARYDEVMAGLLAEAALPARERLLSYWRQWLDHQACGDAKEQCLAVKLAAEVVDLSAAMREALDEGMQRVIRRIETAILAGQRDGSLSRAIDAATMAQALYALWVGASTLSKVRRAAEPLHVAFAVTESWLAPAG